MIPTNDEESAIKNNLNGSSSSITSLQNGSGHQREPNNMKQETSGYSVPSSILPDNKDAALLFIKQQKAHAGESSFYYCRLSQAQTFLENGDFGMAEATVLSVRRSQQVDSELASVFERAKKIYVKTK